MGEVVVEVDHEIKWIKHYSSCHKILLVGEGDFSFAACLAKAFATASNIVATSLDSRGVISVAWEGEDKDKVVVIGDGVDAATLTRNLSKKLVFIDLLLEQVHNVNYVHHLHLSINCTSNIM
ncbi:hypothetical protein EZV62_009371 [Acer yangbiense]|uniref:25S rRNA (uridine-N(3))-methyltransferase BMT5-like domain-containing protein n=1 Tax=Acer yangbiense TaxID=1000413 RepID=A0A5C7IHY8_9ROSI|nr:hypothetical protein EZV62_009371 [Acer yangbiense]